MFSKVRAWVFMIRGWHAQRQSAGIFALVMGHMIMKFLPQSIRKYRYILGA